MAIERTIDRLYRLDEADIKKALWHYLKNVLDIPVPADPEKMFLASNVTLKPNFQVKWTEHAIIEDAAHTS
jgi:metal-sulfur cluster biosynthetic enzyme